MKTMNTFLNENEEFLLAVVILIEYKESLTVLLKSVGERSMCVFVSTIECEYWL